MLTFLRLLVLALLVSANLSTAAVYKYSAAAECVVISKNLRITVISSPEPTCCVSVPTALNEIVEVSHDHNCLTVKQIKPTTNASVIAVTLPTTSKLSCYITNGTDLTILNNGSTVAPLDLKLFNGGTASVSHGTYAACSLTIHGLGEITLNEVETSEPLRVHINGFGSLYKSQNDFSMGGMSLKNGALVHLGTNTISGGKRTSYTPEFADVSLEDLVAYATGTKQHPELPTGWSSTLPDKQSPSTTTPQTPKKTPEITPSATTAQELLKIQADLEAKLRAELDAVREAELKRAEQAVDLRRQELAEDTKYYGAQIRGLSYQQVKAILLDDKIVEGTLPKELFRVNGVHTDYHPFCLHALANRIKFSIATEEQKRELWTILLFRKISVTDIIIDDFKRVTRYLVHTPNSLWGYVGEATRLQSAIRTFKPWLYAGMVIAGETAWMFRSNSAEDGAEQKKIPKMYNTEPSRTISRMKTIAGIAIPLFVFFYFYGKGRAEVRFEQTRNLFFIRTLEECVEKIFYITNEYKDFMPADLVSLVNAFNNKDCQLKTYRTYGTVDIESFKTYHATVCNFYNELGRKAGLVH